LSAGKSRTSLYRQRHPELENGSKERDKKYRLKHKARRVELAKKLNKKKKAAVDWCRTEYGIHWRKEVRKIFGYEEPL